MSQGFAATSCDQIAARAGAGKASLYARYPNKEALFETVVRRCAERITLANVFREEEDLPTSLAFVLSPTISLPKRFGPRWWQW